LAGRVFHPLGAFSQFQGLIVSSPSPETRLGLAHLTLTLTWTLTWTATWTWTIYV